MSEVTLLPYQTEHYARISEIIERSFIAVDSSPTGRGKSFIALKLAQSYNLPVCVICPANMINKWKELCYTYDVEAVDIISYQKLRGTMGKVKNNILTIIGETYRPTDYFLENVEKGMFLIYDEVQNLMNESMQSRAAQCLTRALIRNGPQSRILALSATPCCRQRHCYPLLKVFGFCVSQKFYDYDHAINLYTTKGYGYEELMKKAQVIDQVATEEIKNIPLTNRTANNICYSLLANVFLPTVRSFMPSDNTILDAKLGLYNFPQDDIKLLVRAHNSIMACVDETTGLIRCNITKPCRQIGMACVNTLCRLTEEDLAQGYKVIIFAEYHTVIDALYQRLQDYNPLILSGKVEPDVRTKRIEVFQEPNFNYPLFIVNPKVGGCGIDLDDQHGGFPRKSYLIPSYYFIDSIQAAGRTHRAKTRSIAKVRIVESAHFTKNTKILSSIIEKSQILKTINGDTSLVLPIDYPRIREEDDV